MTWSKSWGIKVITIYSDGQKSCTFFLEFFCDPPGGGGPILELVDFVKWNSPTAWFFLRRYLKWFHKIDQFQNWSHYPRGGGHEKIREKMCKTFAHHCISCKSGYFQVDGYIFHKVEILSAIPTDYSVWEQYVYSKILRHFHFAMHVGMPYKDNANKWMKRGWIKSTFLELNR